MLSKEELLNRRKKQLEKIMKQEEEYLKLNPLGDDPDIEIERGDVPKKEDIVDGVQEH
jgi:hypothetical protein